MIFVFFFFKLLQLSMIISRSIHAAANDVISFLFMADYSMMCTCYNFFIHSSVSGHLGCFHALAAVSSKHCFECFVYVDPFSLQTPLSDRYPRAPISQSRAWSPSLPGCGPQPGRVSPQVVLPLTVDKLSVKGQTVNILGFVGHTVSTAPTGLCHGV